MKEFYILRHSKIDREGGKKICGITEVPLSDEGIQAILKTASFFSKIAFDAIYVSSLKRAYESAFVIGQRQTPPLKPIIDPRINPRSFGSFEGKRFIDIFAQLGIEYKKENVWQFVMQKGKPYGFEDLQVVAKRVSLLLQEVKKSSLKHVLFCVHGTTSSVMFNMLLNKPIDNFQRLRESNYHKFLFDDEGGILSYHRDLPTINVP